MEYVLNFMHKNLKTHNKFVRKITIRLKLLIEVKMVNLVLIIVFHYFIFLTIKILQNVLFEYGNY